MPGCGDTGREGERRSIIEHGPVSSLKGTHKWVNERADDWKKGKK
jgi:hypothetical protein